MILAPLLPHLLPPPETLPELGARIALTLLVAFVVQRLLFLLWGRLTVLMTRAAGEKHAAAQRAQTLEHIFRHLTTVMLTLIAVIHVLELLGWDVKPLVAGAGILGVALGFGAQTLVRDWIAGIAILTENQFDVGDLIELNGRAATVEALTVRSTRLRDFNGYVHFVPNGEMKVVTNRSRGWNRQAVDVTVQTGQDLDRALEVCRAVASAMSVDPAWRERLFEPAQVWSLEQIGVHAVIRMVVRARPGAETAEASRELRQRVHGALVEAGIRYPALAAAPASAADLAPPA
ncbi:MAG: mechanosensitive ion channel [Candidatus Eisenbacteria bacterium]|nr:mechanosensitive ion channel [Candidatus Eisenbacteria bacterium]